MDNYNGQQQFSREEMQMPSVSVIIPVYQGQQTIAAAIGSVLSQDADGLELIVVDDGSTDATRDIVDAMAAADSRVVAIHTPNRGRQAARFTGVEAASSEWVTFVDADDKLPPDAISKLAAKATDDVDIVFGNAYTLGIEGADTIDISTFRHMAVRGDGTIGVPWGSLYRHRLMKPYLFDLPKAFYMGEDYIFWLRLVFSTSKPVALVHDCVYDKGDDTTSSRFVWTADYAQSIQHYREESIPGEAYAVYLPDTISDRLANLCSVALCQADRQWRHHPFTTQLKADITRTHYPVPLSTRIFLQLPTTTLRRCYRRLVDWLRH